MHMADHYRMSTMIQIRNVPEALHRRLKARAAVAGKSLSDYLLAELAEAAERPTVEKLRARLAARTPVSPSPEPASRARGTRGAVIVVDALLAREAGEDRLAKQAR